MAAVHCSFSRIGHVQLRVRDLSESVTFYESLLGLQCVPPVRSSEKVCRCVSPEGRRNGAFAIVLVEGLPAGTELAGMDHLCLEVDSNDEVERVYSEAERRGFRATRPRLYDGQFQTFIFDPDGYKVEVAARALSSEPRP